MRVLSFVIVCVLLVSCSPKIQEIEYGTDACDFCRMGIVDKGHASQLVTSKGKNLKFDAIECMLHFMVENQDNDYAYTLVSNLEQPGTLINADKATYIISKNIPSPMGASLSAVSDKERGIKVIEEFTGDIYTWTEIKDVMRKK